MQKLTERQERNFLRKISKKEAGCWIWTAYKNKEGYGNVKLDGKVKKAHRVSYEYHTGPIPAGLLVCHTCDNPSCVNPDHLFTGTDADNAKDRSSKDRGNRPFGNSHTGIQVMVNGVRYGSGRLAAKALGVNPTTIFDRIRTDREGYRFVD